MVNPERTLFMSCRAFGLFPIATSRVSSSARVRESGDKSEGFTPARSLFTASTSAWTFAAVLVSVTERCAIKLLIIARLSSVTFAIWAVR